jgi:polyphosphate kinase 2 (PPK2 family)
VNQETDVDYRKKFLLEPGHKVKLDDLHPGYTGKHISEDRARDEIEKSRARWRHSSIYFMRRKKHALLIVLQGMDAAGKNGTVSHVMSAMNPQGTILTSFKEPTALDLEHDFLWRLHPHAPAKGTVTIFNRSHYEDVLVVRVHHLAPIDEWSERFQQINDFEELLYRQNRTHIIKFFLHISKEEHVRQRFSFGVDPSAASFRLNLYSEACGS